MEINEDVITPVRDAIEEVMDDWVGTNMTISNEHDIEFYLLVGMDVQLRDPVNIAVRPTIGFIQLALRIWQKQLWE